MSAIEARKRSRPFPYDDIEDSDDLYNTRMPTSVRRYKSAPPHQADTLDDLVTTNGKPFHADRLPRNTTTTRRRSSSEQKPLRSDVGDPNTRPSLADDLTPESSRLGSDVDGLNIKPFPADHLTRERSRLGSGVDGLNIKPTQRRSSLRTQHTTTITPNRAQRHTSGVASNALTLPQTELPRFRLPRPRSTWVTLLIGMTLMVILIMLLSSAFSWFQTYQDDLRFGRPRTYQFDAVVGHNDNSANPTHFILINLHRHIQVIEFPGGDSSHAHIYYGPALLGEGQDLVPVTGEIRDVNGRKDLVLHIQNQEIVFINDGSTFHTQ